MPSFTKPPADTCSPVFSIIIPAYNEEARLRDTIPWLVQEIRSVSVSVELIIVDDGSNDGTPHIIRDFLKPLGGRGRFIRFEANRGKGNAVKAGLMASKGKFVIVTDADLPYTLDESIISQRVNASHVTPHVKSGEKNHLTKKLGLNQLENLKLEPNEVYVGHRMHTNIASQTLIRRVAGLVFRMIVQLLFFLPVRDTQCGFKLFSGSLVRSVAPQLSLSGFSFDVELLVLLRNQGAVFNKLMVYLVNDKGSTVSLFRHGWRMLFDLFELRLSMWGLLDADQKAGRTQTFICMGFILLFVFALYGKMLFAGGIYFDDGGHYLNAASQSFSDLLFTIDGLRSISWCHLTPVLGICSWIENFLAGPNLLVYNIFGIFHYFLLGAGCFLFLRQYIGNGLIALLVSMAFLATPATFMVAAYHSTRHYLVGMTLFLFSLYSLRKFQAVGQAAPAEAHMLRFNRGLGAFYFTLFLVFISGALLSKEIFVLPSLLAPILLSIKEKKSVLLTTVFTSVLVIAYILVRAVVTGKMLGSYTQGPVMDVELQILDRIKNLRGYITWVFDPPTGAHFSWATFCAVVTLIIVAFLLFRRRWGWKGIFSFLLLFCFITAAPFFAFSFLSPEAIDSGRYAFPLAAFVIIAPFLALGPHRRSRFFACTAAFLIILASVTQGYALRHRWYQVRETVFHQCLFLKNNADKKSLRFVSKSHSKNLISYMYLVKGETKDDGANFLEYATESQIDAIGLENVFVFPKNELPRRLNGATRLDKILELKRYIPVLEEGPLFSYSLKIVWQPDKSKISITISPGDVECYAVLYIRRSSNLVLWTIRHLTPGDHTDYLSKLMNVEARFILCPTKRPGYFISPMLTFGKNKYQREFLPER